MAQKSSLGFELDELLSAFQKEIRRGNTLSAIGFALDAQRSEAGIHVIRRMKTILSEDIGLANLNLAPELFEVLAKLEDLLNKLKCERGRKKPPKGKVLSVQELTHQIERMFVDATILLAESPKSRLVDNVALTFYNFNTLIKEQIEDKDFEDKVAKKRKNVERILKKGDPRELLLDPLASFWAALKLGDERKALYWLAVIDTFTFECAARMDGSQKRHARRAGHIIWEILFDRIKRNPLSDAKAALNEEVALQALQKLYWERGEEWPKRRRDECLHIIQGVLRVMRRKEPYMTYIEDEGEKEKRTTYTSLFGDTTDIKLVAIQREEDEGETQKEKEEGLSEKEKEVEDKGKKTISVLEISMPDYAVDKHTKRGREKGRGIAYFFEVGALLGNHKREISDPYEEEMQVMALAEEQRKREKKKD